MGVAPVVRLPMARTPGIAIEAALAAAFLLLAAAGAVALFGGASERPAVEAAR